MYPTCHGLWLNYKPQSIIKSLTFNMSSLTGIASCPECDGLSPALKRAGLCTVQKALRHFSDSHSPCGCLDTSISRSERRGMWSKEQEGAGRRFTRERQSHLFPGKGRRWYSVAFGYCTFIPKITVRFGLGSFWIKACALQLPLCSPLSEIIIFCTCQWDMVKGKLRFWRTRCRAVRLLWTGTFIYTFWRKKGHSPPYL